MSDTKIKTSNIGNLAVTHALLHTDMDLTSKTVQVATPTSNTHPATKAYVDTEVANLIDSAPGTLDTLNELAAAINDDANFNATIASSIATKLPLAGGTLTGNLTLASTASGTSASPELELRRDITGVDANYLGQIKFTADNDADQNVVFAKITGKILDASDGTEDGIIEFAHKKAGSNNISARFRSDSLQLINGTNLTVAGTTDLTGNLTVDTNTFHVDTSNNKVGIGTDSPSSILHVTDGDAGLEVIPQTANDRTTLLSYDRNTSTYQTLDTDSLDMHFNLSGTERMRINTDGDISLASGGRFYFGGANRATATNAQAYIKETGLNLDIKGNDNVRLLGDGGSVILHADYTGNVGIGTDSPGEKLDVNGTIRSIGNNNPNYSASLVGRYDSTHSLALYSRINSATNSEILGVYAGSGGTAPRTVINPSNGWKVGIGTTNPVAKLDVEGTGTAANPTVNITTTNSDLYNHAINAFNPNLTSGEGNVIVVGQSGTTKNSGYVGYKYSGNSGNDENIVSLGHWGNNWLLNVKGDGTVGIGTENPKAKVETRGINESQDATAPANATTDESPITMLRGANGGSIQEWVHSTKAVTAGSGGTQSQMISWYGFKSPGGWSGTGTPGQWEISCQISGMHASGNRVKTFKILPSNNHGNISTQGGLQQTTVYKVFEGGGDTGAAYATTLDVGFYFGNSTDYGYTNGTIYMKVTHKSREPIMTMSARYIGGTGNNRNYHQLLHFRGTHELNNHGPSNISSLSIIHQTGTVHQVVQTVVKNRNSTNTTDADALGGDVGLKTFITPKSGNSKFLIQLHVGVATCTGGNSWGFILSKSGSRVDGAHGDFFSNHRGGIWVRGPDRTGNNGQDGNHGVGCSATYLDETSSSAGTQIFYQAGAVTEGTGFFLNRVEGNYAVGDGSSSEMVSAYTTSTLTITEIEK